MGDRFQTDPEYAEALPGSFAATWTGLQGKTVGRNLLRHVERVDRDGSTYYVKYFHRPTCNDLVRNLCTAPRARSQGQREWLLAGLLEEAGVRAVRRVAYGHRLRWGLEQKSLFLSLEQEGPTLGAVLRQPDAALTAPARSLGLLLSRLLTGGFYLPDLSLEHILVTPEGEFCLLDLHNGVLCRRLSERRIARMLGRLWAGALDTVGPRRALRTALDSLRGLRPPATRRRILAEAAARGRRWADRERRKRAPEVAGG